MTKPKDDELVRTNRLLLGVAVAAVVLLGPSFLLGYFSGYRTGLQSSPPDPPAKAPASSQPARPTASAAERKSSQRTAGAPSAGPSGKQQDFTQTEHAERPTAGQVYLQVITAAKERSAAIIEELRSGGFPVVASDVPEKPSLHRVLVGPLIGGEVEKTRAELQSKGFPGESAIQRTF